MLLKQIVEEFMLYEGLDITHNTRSSSDQLNLWWNFDGKISYHDSGVKLNMYFSKNIFQKDLDIVLKIINNMGYFPSVMIQYNRFVKFDYDSVIKFLAQDNMNGYISRIDFEPKFDPEILQNNIPDIAYHLAPTQNKEKILKLGLAPKSKEKISKHPARIYLADSINAINILARHSRFSANSSLTVFEVNLRELKKVRMIRWFIDPNFKNGGGFYAYENIPPKYIKVKEEIIP